MTKQITLEEVLKLVSFEHRGALGWGVCSVFGNIYGAVNGAVNGDIYGDVKGDIYGDIGGGVIGTITGNDWGTISGRKWEFVETPKEKLQRLITESGNQELIDTFNQLEDNS
jgi:hypothetical protein